MVRFLRLQAIAITLWATIAGADDGADQAAAPSNAVAAADALFSKGRDAMDRSDFSTACRRFRESYRLDPAPGALLNLAECERRRGRLAQAWSLFREASEKLPRTDRRREVADARAKALEKLVPSLTVRLDRHAPARTTVRRGSFELSAASLGIALPVNPGSHHIVVSSPGHTPKTIRINLDPGERRVLTVSPGPATDVPTRAAAPHGRTDTEQGAGEWTSKDTGYVLTGVGAVGLVVGAVTGGLLLHKKSVVDESCDPDTKFCNPEGVDAAATGRTLAPISTAGFIVGAVGIGAGAYLILSRDRETGTETALVPSLGSSASQLSLVRTW